jgi:hypothetical protein
MIYTLIFGAPVVADGTTLGKVERILVQMGVANQFTVDPGLFGTERVVPLSDVRAANEDSIELRTSENEWQAYPAFDIESMLPETAGAMPGLPALTPQHPTAPANITDPGVPTLSADVPAQDVTIHEGSAVLSAKTSVASADGTEQRLHGLVLDTGRPVQVLVEGGQPVSIKGVRSLTSEQIRL